MYSVSEAYLTAFRKLYRTDRITGRIKLKDGTNLILSNENLVQGGFTITRKVCGSTYDIGTFNAGEVTLSLRDEAAKDLDFGGAVMSANYELVTGGTADSPRWERVPLGVFYIDGQQTTRRGKNVTLRGFDGTSKFDIDLPLLTAAQTLWDGLVQACLRANVGLAVDKTWFDSLPNSGITPDYTSKKIQSCRDLVMWIAQAVGCCAFIDRDGFLQLKRYYYGGDGRFDRLVTAAERTKIEYTDTRTYLAYLTSYAGNSPKLYEDVTEWVGPDTVKEGGMSLPNNPLLSMLSVEQQDAANMALVSERSYPTRYIKSTGFIDPATDLMDVLAFTGGTIDIGQIISVCTEIKWKYRGSGHIICNNLDQYSEDADSADTANVMMLADDEAEAQAETAVARSPIKSQLEKRVDALEAGGTGGGDTIEHAIIIQQKDVSHLLHEYTIIKYFAGNKAVYAGPANQIIVGQRVFVSSTTFDRAAAPMYAGTVEFARGWYSNNVQTLTFMPQLTGYNINYTPPMKNVKFVMEGSALSTPVSATTSTQGDYGFTFVYNSIVAPDGVADALKEAFPYGYVTANAYRVAAASTSYGSASMAAIYVGFADVEEFNCAVGLTYEPEYEDEVQETITVVPDSEITSGEEILQLAYAYTDNAVQNHESSVNAAIDAVYGSISQTNSNVSANAAQIELNTSAIDAINDPDNGILAQSMLYTDTKTSS